MAPTKPKTGRGKSWTGPELNRMLTAVEDILPLGANEWENVATRYGLELPREFSERDMDAIKRKFMVLKNSIKPTGDPACPKEVVRVKRAYYKMECRSGVEELEDTVALPLAPDDTILAAPTGQDTTTAASTSPSAAFATPAAAVPQPSAVDSNAEHESGARSASKRCGKTPNQLAALSDQLKRSCASAEGVVISHTVKRRRTIDSLLSKLERENGDGSDMMQAIVAMEERAAAREMEYRRERDEREAKREEREHRRDELFFVLMAKLLGDKAEPSSS